MNISNKPKHLEELQKSLEGRLGTAGLEYLNAGLNLFHEYRRQNHPDILLSKITYPSIGVEMSASPQAALGNLAIAVELLLKAIIAGKNLALIFRNLDPETQVVLLCPTQLRPESAWWGQYLKIVSAETNTIEFDDCLKIFFMFFPDLKQEFEPTFLTLKKSRNASVHFVLPDFDLFDLERAAYVALRINEILHPPLVESLSFLQPMGQRRSEDDKTFMSNFEHKRADYVADQINQARAQAKKLQGKPQTALIPADWNHFIVTCPICSSDGVADGYTELVTAEYGPDDSGQFLVFIATQYKCTGCHLTLRDSVEMQLAGLDIHFVRKDEIEDYLALQKGEQLI